MLDNLDIKTLYLIDPYREFPKASGGGMDSAPGKEEALVKLSDYTHKIVWIHKFSWDATEDIPDELDFVYIDGDHRREAVEKDISLYYPKVKDGGLLCGHDYNKRGVYETVRNSFLYNIENVQFQSKDWWIVKEIVSKIEKT